MMFIRLHDIFFCHLTVVNFGFVFCHCHHKKIRTESACLSERRTTKQMDKRMPFRACPCAERCETFTSAKGQPNRSTEDGMTQRKRHPPPSPLLRQGSDVPHVKSPSVFTPRSNRRVSADTEHVENLENREIVFLFATKVYKSACGTLLIRCEKESIRTSLAQRESTNKCARTRSRCYKLQSITHTALLKRALN